MDAPLLAETDMDRPQRPHAASTDSADIAYASAVAAPPLSHSYSQAQMQRTAEDLGGDDDTKWSSAKRGPKSRRMSWRKLCLQLGVLWLAVFAIGLIADRLVYGQPFVLHTQASMSM